MAIDAGDVVITFLGDTTQLHESFQQVNTAAAENIGPAQAQVESLDQSFTTMGFNAQSASGRAALAAAELRAAQEGLRNALNDVNMAEGATAANLEALAAAETRATLAAEEARVAQTALKTELIASKEQSGIFAEALGDVGSKLMAGLALVAIAEQAKEFTFELVKSTVELDNLRMKSEMSIQTLAGLRAVTEENGVSFETVGNGLVKLQRAQELATEHAGKQRKAFAEIGIGLEELKGLKGDELFFRVAEGLDHAATAGVAVDVSTTLMSKSGAAIIPVIRSQGEAFRDNVIEAGKLSGVNDANAAASRQLTANWAQMGETLKSSVMPMLELLVPVLRTVDAAIIGTVGFTAIMHDAFNALALATADTFMSVGKIIRDVMTGDLTGAIEESKKLGNQMRTDWRDMTTQMGNDMDVAKVRMEAAFKDVKPFKPFEEGGHHAAEDVKVTAASITATYKEMLDKQLALIELDKQQNKLAYDLKIINAKQWAAAEVKATDDASKAHAQYATDLDAALKKAGFARQAEQASQKQSTQLIKEATDETKAYDAALVKLSQNTFWKDAEKEIHAILKPGEDAYAAFHKIEGAVEEMQRRDPFPQWAKDALALNEDLKKLGIEGAIPLRVHLDEIKKAEDRLTDAKMKGGKIWQEVEKARLEATIKLMQIEGQSTKQEERDLEIVKRKLKEFDTQSKDNVKSIKEMKEEMKQYVEEFVTDVGTAFAKVIQGQESFGKAMAEATGKLISQMALLWSKWFAGMAIADLMTPGKQAIGAAELAASVALGMLAGLAGSIGGSGGSGGGGGGTPVTVDTSQKQNQPGAAPTGGVNVPHLAAGGLITGPTLAELGEEDRREAVIPLDNEKAVENIAKALGKHAESMGQGHMTVMNFNIKGMLSTSDLVKTGRAMTYGAQTGRVRMTVTNSSKLTRRA